MGRVILFTEVFPYYGRETFLEVEIKYLAQSFDKVYLFPFRSKGTDLKPLPSNCEVMPAITKTKVGMYLGLLVPSRAHLVFTKELFSKKVFSNWKSFKTWIIAFAMTNSYLHNKTIRKVFKESDEGDVFYSYWGKGGCFLAPFLNWEGKFISRFHGEWDLWEERCGNYGPLRQEILSRLSIAFPISNKGEQYLKSRYNTNRVVVSRLGTQYHGKSYRSKDGCFRIVSCSTIDANKRVLYMLDVFSSTTFPIEWTHIGIGPDMETLQNRVKANNNPNLKVNIKGRLANNEVFDYYLSNPVDCFINLSYSEGIPVSIMEAISCNIPVIATNVGSTSEIVCDETGVLLTSEPTIEDVLNAIQKIKNGDYAPFDFWNQNYNAKNNYRKFIVELQKK